MKKNNELLREEGQFYEVEENGHTRTHIEILGIDFSIAEGVPVTDVLQKILRNAAEHHIQRPVAVTAYEGKIRYSIASPEKIEGISQEHRRKVVVSGIETELLAASYDDTPIPALTQEHVEHAAKEVWLSGAYAELAMDMDEFPGPSDPDDFVVMFPPSIFIKYHQVPSIKNMEGA